MHAPPPLLPVVFSLFPSLITAWFNECPGLILLSPSSSSSSFTSLFPPFLYVFVPYFLLHWVSLLVLFALLLLPHPLLVTQRVGIDQGDSPDLTQVSLHLISINHSVNQYWESSQSHNASFLNAPVPYSPYRPAHTAAAPFLLLSSPLSFAVFLLFLCESRVEKRISE